MRAKYDIAPKRVAKFNSIFITHFAGVVTSQHCVQYKRVVSSRVRFVGAVWSDVRKGARSGRLPRRYHRGHGELAQLRSFILIVAKGLMLSSVM